MNAIGSGRVDLIKDALQIWRAGVHAVQPRSLIQRKIQRDGQWLIVDHQVELDLTKIRRVILVGAGKASAGMAEEFLLQQCRDLPSGFPEFTGWINAPEGTFDKSNELANRFGVHLHAARPAGSNSPTQAAIKGTEQILRLIGAAGANDLVICMISGGGSALLVAPQVGISLADKQAVSKVVAAAGGNIVQLNTLRQSLSRVKGGGLARHCNSGTLLSLIISDVLGDPLESIASGPTSVGTRPNPMAALSVLHELSLIDHPELTNVVRWLKTSAERNVGDSEGVYRHVTEFGASKGSSLGGNASPDSTMQVYNIVLGSLADAVDAAGVRAVELGYQYFMEVARELEGDVSLVADRLSDQLVQMMIEPQVNCLISGGEPTVKLPSGPIGLGGRNQQLALGVLCRLLDSPVTNCHEFLFLSAGTDGEDGPTDAAGGWVDKAIIERARQSGLNPIEFFQSADAYRFFDQVGGLLQTGPTGTNVCDLRVGLVRRRD